MQFEIQYLRSTNAVRKIKTCYLQLSLKFTRKRWLIFKFYRIEGVVISERFRASTRPLPIKKMCVVDRAKGQYNFGKNPYYNQNNFHDHWIFQNSRFFYFKKNKLIHFFYSLQSSTIEKFYDLPPDSVTYLQINLLIILTCRNGNKWRRWEINK